MADPKTINEIVDYYSNLLIIQYHDKPKAVAHIQLLIQVLFASGVMLDVLNGYDIDTAVGHQLDIIGKYVGIDRFFSEEDLTDYFAFTYYADVNPDTQPKFGFSTYATFGDYQFNGTLTYDDIVETQNALSDADFRILLKLAILRNTCNMSNGAIDEGVFNIFGTTIRSESPGNMRMAYFFTTAISSLIQAMIIKKVLPKPMAVLLTYVQQNGGLMFGFTDYTGVIQPEEYGFSTYANFGTLPPGQCLTYNQIIGAD